MGKCQSCKGLLKMRRESAQLIFSLFLCLLLFLLTESKRTRLQVNVGVVLDMDTWVGKMRWSCISMALSDLYASHGYYNTRLVLKPRDSKDDDAVGAAAAALDLLKNVQVEAIIGPATSMQANFVVNLGEKAQVPIISFSATSPSVSSIQSPYFIRATHNDSSQVKAISAIIQAYGWREAVLIYADNEFGEGIIPFLIDALQEIDTRIPYRSVISPLATDDQISTELYKLMTMQTRVFIVHMSPPLGSKLFTKAKEVGMMSEGYVWIITDGLTDLLSSLDFSTIDSMQGVLGIKTHVPRTKQLEDFKIRWKSTFQQDNPTEINAELNIFGLWAYDAATALAMAVEKLGVTSMGFQRTNISGNSTDLESFGISQNGLKLLQALKSTTFRGLCGDFHIIDGQLQSSVYQIVNVIGNGEKGIGFWTAKNGIVRELKSTITTTYSTSSTNLGVIIWPGDTRSPPKGWVVIPSNGKKLKVGVPVKDGFSEFVKITGNLDNNTLNVTGYSINVFDAVMAALPYPVVYEYSPFETPDGKSAGTYDDLVYQVFLGNFDAVAGDITIRANRSLYVDWTLPYTESGVSMIAPTKDNKSKNAWVFLKPLTRELWVTSFCSFVFIGFAIWVLEHRINEDFRGPPSHQVGTIFWFPFSTLVFAHRERVVSNLARFVVVIWVLVVFILTQSYTASLTSMLTVQQLQPTVADVNELISKGEYVGYQNGSFVLGLLKQMNFDESKLKVYDSPEECHELLSKGSRNGGIAAAFEEIPYIKLFLEKYCSKYTMVPPIYKTDGFGFAFPKGSRLVPDVSRAVLHVTEGDAMVEIEQIWIRNQSTCPDPSSSSSSSSLGVGSFWGLFLIAGVASFSALIIYTAFFLKEHRHVLSSFDPKASIWRKFVVMARHFDQKDLSSHTFKKSELRYRSVADNMSSMHTVEPCQNNNFPPPSPSSFSNHPDANFFGDQQATPSLAEYGNSNPNVQTPQEMVSAIELSNPNQDRLSA